MSAKDHGIDPQDATVPVVALFDLRAQVARLQASFDAHHPPNLQEGFRCNICGEDHPHALAPEPWDTGIRRASALTDIDHGFAAVQRLAAESEALRELLVQADSMLSLLRHRGDIRNWGATGMVEQHEVDALIGRLRRTYEPVRPT